MKQSIEKLTREDLRKALANIKDCQHEYEKEVIGGIFVTYQAGTPIKIRLGTSELKKIQKLLKFDLRNVRNSLIRRNKIITLEGIPIILSR